MSFDGDDGDLDVFFPSRSKCFLFSLRVGQAESRLLQFTLGGLDAIFVRRVARKRTRESEENERQFSRQGPESFVDTVGGGKKEKGSCSLNSLAADSSDGQKELRCAKKWMSH